MQMSEGDLGSFVFLYTSTFFDQTSFYAFNDNYKVFQDFNHYQLQ